MILVFVPQPRIELYRRFYRRRPEIPQHYDLADPR